MCGSSVSLSENKRRHRWKNCLWSSSLTPTERWEHPGGLQNIQALGRQLNVSKSVCSPSGSAVEAEVWVRRSAGDLGLWRHSVQQRHHVTVHFWNRCNQRCRHAFQDYHVILLQVGLESDPQVYDLDSDLSFPCSMELYASQALRSDRSLRPAYHR